MPMRIIIVHDQIPANARADEADARVQAETVLNALHDLGHRASIIEATLDLNQLKSTLLESRPDLVFNLVESLNGQGRLIHVVPGLLESLDVSFTGASAEAQFTTSNKLIAKQIMRGVALPTAQWHTLDDLKGETASAQPGRYIIKSVWEHASLGLDENSVIDVESGWQMREAIENRRKALGGEAFAERFIEGREFNLAILAGADKPEVLPPAEIIFENHREDQLKIVGYNAKWDEQSFEYCHTPRRYDFPSSDSSLIDAISSLAIDCWRTFNLRGYARVDFRVDENNTPWILEINTNPCLSPDAGFAAALTQAKISLSNAVERIIADSMAGEPNVARIAENVASRA
jgi:D-alanine-D-alanine ligase